MKIDSAITATSIRVIIAHSPCNELSSNQVAHSIHLNRSKMLLSSETLQKLLLWQIKVIQLYIAINGNLRKIYCRVLVVEGCSNRKTFVDSKRIVPIIVTCITCLRSIQNIPIIIIYTNLGLAKSRTFFFHRKFWKS